MSSPDAERCWGYVVLSLNEDSVLRGKEAAARVLTGSLPHVRGYRRH
jgi:hypothetical protein